MGRYGSCWLVAVVPLVGGFLSSPPSGHGARSATRVGAESQGSLEWMRLRVLIDGDRGVEGRRAPFFNLRSFEAAEAAAADEATLNNLEVAAESALRHVALSLGEAEAGQLRERFALIRAAASGDAGVAAFVDAVEGVLSGGTVLIPGVRSIPGRGYAEAFGRFATEVACAVEPVDFCLSLLDRRSGGTAATNSARARGVDMETMSATRALNDASNALLRAASYGSRGDVAATREELRALRVELPSLRGYEEGCGAYLAALELLALSEREYTAERAAVEEASFATFYLEGDGSGKNNAPAARLGADLGDAYAVALQRFLGELTRRGAIAGGTASVVAGGAQNSIRAPDFSDDASPSALASTSTNPLIAGLNFNFAEWEMKFRRRLALRRGGELSGLQPSDFVGTWRLTLVEDDVSQKAPILGGPDVLNRKGTNLVEIEFTDDGVVSAAFRSSKASQKNQGDALDADAPAPAPLKKGKVAEYWEKRKPPRWRVRPGPAHLDTCEFEVDVNEERVAFCGYVDRGQRIESRFSRRPIRVSGFAFEKMQTPRRFDADARPSGQFRMEGPSQPAEADAPRFP